jgi:hypothetical protein
VTFWLSLLVIAGSIVLLVVWWANPKPTPQGCHWVPVTVLRNVVEVLMCPTM